jgi:superfamily I DNA and/or RNA helicase
MNPALFWTRGVGVVTPHRAQQGLVVSRLQHLFRDTGADPADIRAAVDTVERFQGQQRDVMIASYSLGDPDQIATEDEFLLSLYRFNVMASRARAKLVVFVSQEVVDHLSDELSVLRDSRLLKVYAESFCDDARPATFGVIEDGVTREVPATLCHPS